MFRRSVPLYKERLMWTGGGQRRLLKRPMDAMTYIEKAVESQVYRSMEEKERMLRERKLGLDPIQDVMKRFRQDIYRGAAVHDYPDTYLILRQNPIPLPPLVPSVRMRKRMSKAARKAGLVPVNPLDKLTETYLHRFELKPMPGRENPHEYPNGAPLTGEEYYRRLLGVPHAPDPLYSHLGKKAAPLQKAYAAALKHYTLVRTEGLSEHDAMLKVEELLQEEKRSEYQQAATLVAKARKEQQKASSSGSSAAPEFSKNIQQLAEQHEQETKKSWRLVLKGGRKDIALEEWKERTRTPISINPMTTATGTSNTNTTTAEGTPPVLPITKLESLFHNVLGSEPRVLEAMMRWSRRLQAVPYLQWTIGASTALDHWIARQVLGYSEVTWQILLEGSDPSYFAHGEKLVETRQALFPETILHDPHPHHEDFTPTSSYDDDNDDTKKDSDSSSTTSATSAKDAAAQSEYKPVSLEDLLKDLTDLSLSSSSKQQQQQQQQYEQDVEEEKSKPRLYHRSGTTSTITESKLSELDQRLHAVVSQMNEFQRQHHLVQPYEEWSTEQQEQFNHWIQYEFLPACSSPAERFQKELDLTETRNAILAQPPPSPSRTTTTEEQDSSSDDHDTNTAFWNALRNEQDAAKLLDQMRRDGTPSNASLLQAHFWELDYDQQLQQLLNIGSIRPLLDDYHTLESDRRAFLRKYTDVLLTGVSMEYLVPDPKGPIAATDIPSRLAYEMGIGGRQPQFTETMRFRLETRPYRGSAMSDSGDDDNNDNSSSTDDNYEWGRALFLAWNEHKANRARYEEELFLSNRLGLDYANPPPTHDYDDDDDDEMDGNNINSNKTTTLKDAASASNNARKAKLQRRRQKKLDAIHAMDDHPRGGGGGRTGGGGRKPF